MFILILLLIFSWVPQSQARESYAFAEKVIAAHDLHGVQAQTLLRILTTTPRITRNIGTEDPNVLHGPNNSWHPASRAQCNAKVIDTGLIKPNPEFEKICGAKWMAPIPDYPGEPPQLAHVCIDQFEFPDMPCEYPMVWTPAPVTKQICEAMGKRVCNSHEWEGACAGSIDHNDPYRFELSSLQARRYAYNSTRQRVWAYQWIKSLRHVTDTRKVCGVFSATDPEISEPMRSNIYHYYTSIGTSVGCNPGVAPYTTCGTNSWPSGFKYNCRTQNDVFDMHGNVAEVVNFPTSPAGIANSEGVTDRTERKGSFFVYRPEYPDDCRVRQPYEHFNRFATDGMSFYQEGFRCCKDIRH